MIEYLDNRISITKSEYLSSFENHLRGDGHEDKLYELHNEQEELHYYQGLLNERGFKNLVLPHHAVEFEQGKSPDRSVKTGGKYFTKVIEDYTSNYIPNRRFMACHKKAMEQSNKFFDVGDEYHRADFLFVTNNKEIAHLNDEYNSPYSSNCIFIGNGFHRMIAFGLFTNANGFKPLEIHYVRDK